MSMADELDKPDDLGVLPEDPEIATMFIAEALDHLGSIEALVLQLEEHPGDASLLNDIFRPFHTVKGNAGALGLMTIQDVAHKVESLLDMARGGQLTLGTTAIDVVLKSVDLLTVMIQDLPSRLAGKAPTDVSAQRAQVVETLDTLILAHTAGHAAGQAAPAEAPAAEAPAAPVPEAATASAGRQSDETVANASVKVDTQKLDNLVDTVGELMIVQSIIRQDPALQHQASDNERLARNLAQLWRITSELQRGAMALRMVPIRRTFQKTARLVRDLSRKSGKMVQLVVQGEDTELDRKVVEDLDDPLLHMVRNSIDHGLETKEERPKTGKPLAGTITLRAFHQGDMIVVAVGDDGAGLDTEKIYSRAVSRGLVRPDESMTESDIQQLIFRPGFSTADKITEISGRGVGMDVVRRNIEALRGRIEIQSIKGKGTTFLIKLPLTLAIVDGLLLAVNRERYVLPTFAVRESLRPTPSQVHPVQGKGAVIQVRNSLLPLVSLAELFGIEGAISDPCAGTVVVLEHDGRRMGLLVDSLVGKQEVVVKSLGESFARIPGVGGGAILGDGRIGLILDAGELIGTTSELREAA
jgi:two-component system chemotaxis sensor kinase CheA